MTNPNSERLRPRRAGDIRKKRRTMLAKDGQGNTRLQPKNGYDSHCDYLRIHRQGMQLDDFNAMLNFITSKITTLPDKPWSPGAGAVWYDFKLVGIDNLVGGYSISEDGLVSCMFDLPGAFWKRNDLIGMWRLFRGLKQAYKVRVSRVDYAIDDYSFKGIPVKDMRGAWERGENFYFVNHKYIESGKGADDLMKTWYFGSSNSGKKTRIYNHDNECMRHELEVKRLFAQPFFDKIADLERTDFESYEDFDSLRRDDVDSELSPFETAIRDTICSLVLGAIDFRDRGARKDKFRCGSRDSVRLSFYQEYIDKVGASPIKIRPKARERTISKTLEWVKRQCAPTLAMIANGIGRHKFNLWMLEVCKDGDFRMDKLKRLWEQELSEKPELVPI